MNDAGMNRRDFLVRASAVVALLSTGASLRWSEPPDELTLALQALTEQFEAAKRSAVAFGLDCEKLRARCEKLREVYGDPARAEVQVREL